MNRRPLNTLFVSALLVLSLAGCPAAVKAPPPLPEAPGNAGSAGAYYYFTQAQIEKEKGDTEKALAWMQRAADADPESAYLQKELAVLLLIKGENAKARQVIEQMLKRSPDDVDGLILLAGILHHQGDMDGAAGLYERALEKDPDREGLYLMMGSLHIDQGRPEQAALVYEKMTRRFPDLWDGYFFLGNVYKRMGRLEAAEAAYRTSMRLNPEALAPRFELLDIYEQGSVSAGTTVTVKKGDTLYGICRQAYGACSGKLVDRIRAANPEIGDINHLAPGRTIRIPTTGPKNPAENRRRILDLYTGILKDDPDNSRAAFGLALQYSATGNRAAALKILKPLGARSDTDPGLLQPLFQYYIDREKHEAAGAIVSGMLEGAPESPALNYLMGMMEDRRGNREKAIEHLGRVTKESRFYDSARLHTALIHEALDRTDRAAEILSARIEDEPANPEHLLRLGTLYERQKKYEAAAELFRRGIGLDPKHIELIFRLGVVYDKLSRRDDLVTQMSRVIEIDPDNAAALNYLGYTWAEKGENLDQAQALIEKALALEPGDGYITDSLGWVYFKKGDLQQAILYLEKAVTLVPDDPILLEHLGDAYRQRGDLAKALDLYKRSLSHNKEDTSGIKAKIEALENELP